MLVIGKMKHDLYTFIKENHSALAWKDINYLFWSIMSCLYYLHKDNLVHKDLHPGNILQVNGGGWHIADFGLCGPANQTSNSIYGNLPYMAPEVIRGAQYSTAADIYSVGMLMYHVVSGHPPFASRQNDIHLASDICHGIRPSLINEIPDRYKELMQQCWDAEIPNRPTTRQLYNYFHDECKKAARLSNYGTELVNKSSVFPTYKADNIKQSSVYGFQYLPIPRNATSGKTSLIYVFYF